MLDRNVYVYPNPTKRDLSLRRLRPKEFTNCILISMTLILSHSKFSKNIWYDCLSVIPPNSINCRSPNATLMLSSMNEITVRPEIKRDEIQRYQ